MELTQAKIFMCHKMQLNNIGSLEHIHVLLDGSISSKITRLNFNSTQLNFSLDNLLDNESALLTFDLLGLLKMVIPIIHTFPGMAYYRILH